MVMDFIILRKSDLMTIMSEPSQYSFLLSDSVSDRHMQVLKKRMELFSAPIPVLKEDPTNGTQFNQLHALPFRVWINCALINDPVFITNSISVETSSRPLWWVNVTKADRRHYSYGLNSFYGVGHTIYICDDTNVFRAYDLQNLDS